MTRHNWAAGELIELEHAADQCDVRSAHLQKKANDDNDRTPLTTLRAGIRRAEITAAALREFCAIYRQGSAK